MRQRPSLPDVAKSSGEPQRTESKWFTESLLQGTAPVSKLHRTSLLRQQLAATAVVAKSPVNGNWSPTNYSLIGSDMVGHNSGNTMCNFKSTEHVLTHLKGNPSRGCTLPRPTDKHLSLCHTTITAFLHRFLRGTTFLFGEAKPQEAVICCDDMSRPMLLAESRFPPPPLGHIGSFETTNICSFAY